MRISRIVGRLALIFSLTPLTISSAAIADDGAAVSQAMQWVSLTAVVVPGAQPLPNTDFTVTPLGSSAEPMLAKSSDKPASSKVDPWIPCGRPDAIFVIPFISVISVSSRGTPRAGSTCFAVSIGERVRIGAISWNPSRCRQSAARPAQVRAERLNRSLTPVLTGFSVRALFVLAAGHGGSPAARYHRAAAPAARSATERIGHGAG